MIDVASEHRTLAAPAGEPANGTAAAPTDGQPPLRAVPTVPAVPAVPVTSAIATSARQLDRWQRRLLPFLLVGLLSLGLAFFASTVFNYSLLMRSLGSEGTETQAQLLRINADPATPQDRQWASRALLEERALRRGYDFAAVNLQARIWTRFMGFMVGMVMVLSGCLFILARMEVSFDGQAKVADGGGALRTNSPGLVLAVLGTLLMGLALLDQVTQTVGTTNIYLPAQDETGPQVPASTLSKLPD